MLTSDDGANGSENIVLTSGVNFMAMNIKGFEFCCGWIFKGGKWFLTRIQIKQDLLQKKVGIGLLRRR